MGRRLLLLRVATLSREMTMLCGGLVFGSRRPAS
jgi:hypothetical protein